MHMLTRFSLIYLAGKATFSSLVRSFSQLVDDKSGSVLMCVTDETVQADLPWQFLVRSTVSSRRAGGFLLHLSAL